MSTVEVIGDPNHPTSMVVSTRDGYPVDLQNLPGKVKMELIQSGQMDIDRFVTPPNMPGKKLAALRVVHREKVEKQLEELSEKRTNPFKAGDMVTYKDETYEILKVDEHRVQILKDGKEVWVKHMKVVKG